MMATAGLSLTLDPMGKNVSKRKSDWSLTVHECSLDGPLQNLGFLFWYKIQDGSYGRT
jgi:hypothetical protein